MKAYLYYLYRDGELREGPFYALYDALWARENKHFTAYLYTIARQEVDVVLENGAGEFYDD